MGKEIVFECRKCEHQLSVPADFLYPSTFSAVAGMACPNCGEQEEGLWRLLGVRNPETGMIEVEWEDTNED